MKPSELAKPFVLNYPAYVPGRPIEDVARDMGLDPAGIIKLASNENPFGPSPKAAAAAKRAIDQGNLYPDGGCFALRRRLAEFHGLSPDQFVIGNGSNEVIEFLGHVFLNPGDEVVMGLPEFVVYKLVAILFGAKAVEVPLVNFRNDLKALARAVTPQDEAGDRRDAEQPDRNRELRGRAHRTSCARCRTTSSASSTRPTSTLPTDPPDIRPLIAEGRNVIGLRTFSKVYGLASLRVGYGYAGAEMATLLDRISQPFNVNAVAQAAAVAALDDQDFAGSCIEETRKGLKRLRPDSRRSASSSSRARRISSWSGWATGRACLRRPPAPRASSSGPSQTTGCRNGSASPSGRRNRTSGSSRELGGRRQVVARAAARVSRSAQGLGDAGARRALDMDPAEPAGIQLAQHRKQPARRAAQVALANRARTRSFRAACLRAGRGRATRRIGPARAAVAVSLAWRMTGVRGL